MHIQSQKKKLQYNVVHRITIMEAIMEILSKRLRDLRIDADLKQTEMANHIGSTKNSISYYENGREPPPSVIAEYAKHFHVSSDYLLGLTNDPKPADTDNAKEFAILSSLCEAAGGKAFTTMDILSLVGAFTAYYKAGAVAGNVPMDCFIGFMKAMEGVLKSAINGDAASLLEKTNNAAACGLQVSDVLKLYLENEAHKK